jgi:hypothetical protein
MPMLPWAHDRHRNLRPLAPTARTARPSILSPETRAMIQLGSACTTVEPVVSWPMTLRMPIPELSRAQGTPAGKTDVARSLTPHEITFIGPAAVLPDRQRLPARSIPKHFYP